GGPLSCAARGFAWGAGQLPYATRTPAGTVTDTGAPSMLMGTESTARPASLSSVRSWATLTRAPVLCAPTMLTAAESVRAWSRRGRKVTRRAAESIVTARSGASPATTVVSAKMPRTTLSSCRLLAAEASEGGPALTGAGRAMRSDAMKRAPSDSPDSGMDSRTIAVTARAYAVHRRPLVALVIVT